MLTPHIDPMCSQSCIVLVDGVFAPALSSLSALQRPCSGLSFAVYDSSSTPPTSICTSLTSILDTHEEPRDRIGSDLLMALNMAAVSQVRIHALRIV
jgi:hypothetical protein